jgi:hypothetical protein
MALSSVTPATTLAPGPEPKPSSPKAALRRCRAAWQRAFDDYMENGQYPETDGVFAAQSAGEA